MSKDKLKFLHICVPEDSNKFLPPFIEFIRNNFVFLEHIFCFIDAQSISANQKHEDKNVIYVKAKDFPRFFVLLCKAEKIFIHGLFSKKLLLTLFLFPWFLKKCYWVIWSADLYYYVERKKSWKSDIHEFVRRFVIKRMGHVISLMPGDFQLAKEWYQSKAKYHECFIYPHAIYKELNVLEQRRETINIQVGNSACVFNEHDEIFKTLTLFKDKNIKIYCPLSYGDKKNAEEVAKRGKELFGDKFIPLLDFLPFDEYLKILVKIDIAIFNHNRHQAMGNIVVLLGLGKKVYIRNNITTWRYFEEKRIKVYNIKDFNLDLIDSRTAKINKEKIKGFFSEGNLINEWHEIFKS